MWGIGRWSREKTPASWKRSAKEKHWLGLCIVCLSRGLPCLWSLTLWLLLEVKFQLEDLLCSSSLLKGCWNRTNGKRYCLLCGGVPEKIRRDYMKTRRGDVLFFFSSFEQIKVLSSKWIMYACKDMVIITDLLLFKWHLLIPPSQCTSYHSLLNILFIMHHFKTKLVCISPVLWMKHTKKPTYTWFLTGCALKQTL